MLSTFHKLICAAVLCVPFVSRAAVFTSDFSSGNPPATSFSGSAFVGSGVLKITTSGNGQQGNFFLPDFAGGSAITNFRASFNLALGGGTCCGVRMADGMSFVMGSDLASGSVYAEDACCNGIAVTFDTWDNASPDPAPALDVRVANSPIWFQAMGTLGGALREAGRAPDGPVLTNALGQEVQIFTFGPDPTPPVFVPVVMELFADNTFSMSFSNVVVFNHVAIPTYTPVAGANWGFGARTGGANENAWIDDLQIFANYSAGPAILTSQPTPQTVTESQTASFSVQVDGTPVYYFQWRTNGVAIPGATGQSYTTPPTITNMSGLLYSVAVSNALSGGVAVISSSALLTVNAGVFALSASSQGRTNGVHVRFSKNVALSGTYALNNGATVNSVSYGATHRDVLLATTILTPDADYTLTINNEVGEDASSLIPNPSLINFHQGFGALCTGFASLPPGVALFNNAVMGAGLLADDGTGTNLVVHLTDDGNNGAYGKLYVSNRVGANVLTELQATWRTKIGGDLNGHADGLSLNWGNAIGANGNFQASEGGEGNGVSFIIDTWDGGSGPGTGLEIKYQGTRVAFLHIPRTDEGNGNFICKNVFVPTSASVNSAGQARFTYDGNTVSGTIPGWAGITGGAIAISARTGGENDNFWIDDLCINNFTLGPIFFTLQPVETTALEGTSATFTATVDGSPPYFFQWFTNGVPIPGANGPTHTTAPATAAFEGRLYSVQASNSFSSVTSSNAVLHVNVSPRVLSVFSRGNNEVHVIYTRPVNLFSGTYDFDNGVFEATRSYGASHSEVVIITDLSLIANTTYTTTIADVADEFNGASLILPNPTIKAFRHGYGSICADFTALPPGATIQGSASVSGGILHITDAVNGQQGTFFLPDQNGGFPMDQLLVKFRMQLGLPAPNARIADGVSFNVASDINSATVVNLDGTGSGLTVTFDTWDNNGGDTAPAIEVRYKGITVATQAMAGVREGGRAAAGPLILAANGSPLSLETSNQFVNFMILVSPAGKLDMYFKDTLIFQNIQLPNYTPFVGANFAFGGNTGGANENAWIDDLCINTFSLANVSITQQPVDATVNEIPAPRVAFNVGVDGLPPYSVQWYSNGVPVPGATGLAYTTPPLARGANGAGYRAIISNSFNSVTSRTAIVTIQLDSVAPAIVSAAANCVSNVYVTFNEALDPATANVAGNYTINNGVIVTGATLDASGMRVILTVSPNINPNDSDILTVNGVRDVSTFNLLNNGTVKISAKAPFQAVGANNLIVAEAEDFDINRSPGLFWAANNTSGNSWFFSNAFPGFSGTGYMAATPNNGGFSGNTADGITNALRLDYCINFPVAGTYYAWFRGATHINNGAQNSLHFGLDGVISNEFSLRVGNRVNNWGGTTNFNDFGWIRDANGTGTLSVAQITVATPGIHIINVWMREAGLSFDKFLLTTDPAFVLAATDAGPATTPRPATRNISFARAANGDVTLSWLGVGWTLQCATSLTPPVVWRDVDTGGLNTYTVNPSNQFNVNLDTAQSGGGARTGSGIGTITLSGSTLSVDVTYAGLSGNRTVDHFHAPAARGANAGVAYDLGTITTGTTAGTVKGNVTLANPGYGGKNIAGQVQDMRNQLWYLNIHSILFSGGEIRGQVEPAGMRFYRLISP